MDKLSTLSSGLNSGILPRIDVPKWKEEQRTKVRLRLNGRRCETANPTPELLWWGLGRIGSLSWSWSLSLSMSLGSSFGGGGLVPSPQLMPEAYQADRHRQPFGLGESK